MIRKLSKKTIGNTDRIQSLDKVRGGLTNLPEELNALLCSCRCEGYCGTKTGSDGEMWVGCRDF